MNELAKIIPINTENPERITVFARDLHAFLEVDTRFNDWFPRMCEYGFEEGKDFYSFLSKTQNGGRPSRDAELTIDMAKEICMLQRNEKGKIARRYFVELEKAWNSPEKVMARALQIANNQVKQLQAKIEADAPAVRFAEAVTGADTNILVRDLAKILSQNGAEIGGNRLFERLRQDGYLIKSGSDYNMPTQKSMELGLFFVRETPRIAKEGAVIDRTTKVTPRGQKYFINRYAPKQALAQ
nr:MAG TPA: KilAC domain protein [Caudoviricetes sp.]